MYWIGFPLAIAVAVALLPAGARGLRDAGLVRENYRGTLLAFPLGAVLATAAPRGGYLLAGAPRAGTDVGEGVWNSLLAIDSDGAVVATYDSLRSLPLHIDGYYLEPLEREVARGFTLRRTVIVLHGRGEEGRGEEVDYDPMQQTRFQEHGGEMPLAGEHTLESFSLLQSGQTEYRRWALESAALDLALRQSGQSLGEAIGVVHLDSVPSTQALETVRQNPNILSLSVIKLPALGAGPAWLGA